MTDSSVQQTIVRIKDSTIVSESKKLIELATKAAVATLESIQTLCAKNGGHKESPHIRDVCIHCKARMD